MSNAENAIKSRVDAFVNELSGLIRQAALEAVSTALKKGEVITTARRPGRPPKSASAAATTGEKKPVGRPRGRPAKGAKRRAGEKRTPQQLVAVTEQVSNHIKANAGQGVEQIAKALGTTTKELTLPIRKLLSDKKITAKGQKRATRYFPK